jgi:chromate transporter
MVVQFVSFMASWNHPEGLTPLSSATVGALVTTFVTFLPCFLFIFLGAPYIEILRSNRALDATLGGVTAAVVGVVLNLAVVFGTSVLFPQGLEGGIDGPAAGLAALAFLVLWRLRVDVLWVVGGGGLIGLLKGALHG